MVVYCGIGLCMDGEAEVKNGNSWYCIGSLLAAWYSHRYYYHHPYELSMQVSVVEGGKVRLSIL